MNGNITTTKLFRLATSISGKECAFLAIDHLIRTYQDAKNYSEEAEIINSAISPYGYDLKRLEFYFYYRLWLNLDYFCLDLQTNVLLLKILENQLETVRVIILFKNMIRSISQNTEQITEAEFSQGLLDSVEDIRYRIGQIINHLAVVKTIEKDVFEGVVNSSRNSKTVDQSEQAMSSAIQKLDKIVDFLTSKNEKLERYRIRVEEIQPEQEWIDQTIEKIIEATNKESGYSYQLKIGY